MLPALLNASMWYSFLAVGMMVFFYVPWSLLENHSFLTIFGAGLISSAATASIAFYFSNTPPNELSSRRARPNIVLLLAILSFGALLRVAWVLIVPPIQLSDAIHYWNTARHLLETGSYSSSRGDYLLHAWRPPGYPFLLATFMAVLGEQSWLPFSTNLILYVLTSISAFCIATKLSSVKAGLFVALILALWPSFIFMSGLAFSEPLSTFLFTSSFLAYMKAERSGWMYAASAGVLTALGALVRPALLLSPLLWICFIIMKRRDRWSSIYHVSVMAISMMLAIVPWTVRNYGIFGTLVIVSTNGGDVFYRANNPYAAGGYTRAGEKDLAVYKRDEVMWNRVGYTWGLEWIAENPREFLKLAVKKQGIFLGSDDTGIYWTLNRGHRDTGVVYKVLAAISNVWWVGVWVLGIIGATRARHFFKNDPMGGLLISMIFLFIAVHSIFESQPRYHLPFIGLLSVISAFAIYPPGRTGY
jgi:4-amino-4-deoxy-L-arabinose transferase-like glycosyltransferase